MLKELPIPARFMDKTALFLATLGPAGRMPRAPGTWGSLVSAVAAWFLFLPLPLWARLTVLVFLFPLGAWCAGRAEKILDRKDPSCVVIDELWGQWITLVFLPSSAALWIIPGFLLFRLFDIAKPWPVRASEQWLPRGYGVMIDDGVAACYALGVMTMLRLFF
jgi:phosphatidylglycerophosphatase A